ncbi:hypothetical protein BGZ72_004950 [Mortierella alpina]|nr:hypothetical protein BGZ72_004950 [Mortierella alpina]
MAVPASVWTIETFAGYHSYEDHTVRLKAQIKNHSDIATGFSVGKSYQGGEQAGMKIGKGPNNIVLNGLQHAREWITGSVVEYLIHELVTGTDAKVAEYLKKYTFHIIPIMNPDGRWNEGECNSTVNVCSEIYPGPSAFSAPESANMGKYLRDTPNVISYTAGAVAALKKGYGTRFTYGESYITIKYETFGASDDYALKVGVGAPFTVELRDTGNFGLRLPADQIWPSGKEIWEAFKYVLDNLKAE